MTDEAKNPSDEAPASPAPAEPERVPSASPSSVEASLEDPSREGGAQPPTIFVTDPTVEAARIEWALRARGYVVIDVPLAMLVGRVAVQRPHLVLLDVDAPGALATAARVRQLPGASGVHLVYAGEPGETFESSRDALAHEGSGFFARPIDIDALVTAIDALLGVEAPPPTVLGGVRGWLGARLPDQPPVSLAGDSDRMLDRPQSLRPPRLSSLPPPGSMRPPVSPRPSDAPRPEPVRSPSEPRVVVEVPDAAPGQELPSSKPVTIRGEQRYSASLERLLRDAEARVGGPQSLRGPESGPQGDEELLSPEAEVDAVLPAEVLASLDEPLDLDVDHDDVSNAETGGTPHHGTSAGPRATATRDRAWPPPPPDDPVAQASSPGGFDAPTNAGRSLRFTPPPPTSAAVPAVSAPSEAATPHPPRPSPTHPPPLAPKTTRPPAMRPPVSEGAPPSSVPPAPASSPPALAPRSARVASASTALPPPRAITTADEALRALAGAVSSRLSGVLRFDEERGIRRIVLQDGDVVTAASSVDGESLVGFLVSRGDLLADVAAKLGARVPPFGRLAGAALVAHGHLHQDQLWDVLQAHAAWLLTRAVAIPRGRVAFEAEPPQRLRGEPPVFGGTPGPALVVEIVRRSVQPLEATARLGGPDVRFAQGSQQKLADECGLEEHDEELLRRAPGASLRELVESRGDDGPPLLYALATLSVVQTLQGLRPSLAPPPREAEVELADPLRDAELDDAALRARVGARRALVEDGDYFAILGVAREATGYEVKRAYLDLRKALDPARVLRPSLLDLADELALVLAVLDEAYDVLKDPTRRERYRRAIGGPPPRGAAR